MSETKLTLNELRAVFGRVILIWSDGKPRLANSRQAAYLRFRSPESAASPAPYGGDNEPHQPFPARCDPLIRRVMKSSTAPTGPPQTVPAEHANRADSLERGFLAPPQDAAAKNKLMAHAKGNRTVWHVCRQQRFVRQSVQIMDAWFETRGEKTAENISVFILSIFFPNAAGFISAVIHDVTLSSCCPECVGVVTKHKPLFQVSGLVETVTTEDWCEDGLVSADTCNSIAITAAHVLPFAQALLPLDPTDF
ncbi:hypothetical protein CEXT_323151 [Caerostris extrusa]|uniref:Uncharacterized protein n=1 Tax=Caerostris extrusa TaxID=172846 RepID=A0AAV4N3M9_CAEEX|nr:hypothetical protein CEXT_323151 [Caerostris extrusa]